MEMFQTVRTRFSGFTRSGIGVGPVGPVNGSELTGPKGSSAKHRVLPGPERQDRPVVWPVADRPGQRFLQEEEKAQRRPVLKLQVIISEFVTRTGLPHRFNVNSRIY